MEEIIEIWEEEIERASEVSWIKSASFWMLLTLIFTGGKTNVTLQKTIVEVEGEGEEEIVEENGFEGDWDDPLEGVIEPDTERELVVVVEGVREWVTEMVEVGEREEPKEGVILGVIEWVGVGVVEWEIDGVADKDIDGVEEWEADKDIDETEEWEGVVVEVTEEEE